MMNDYYEIHENEYFAYLEAMKILEEAENEEDEDFWKMVSEENWKRFEGCFD